MRVPMIAAAVAALAACSSAETAQQMQARMDQEAAAAKSAIVAQDAKYAAAFNAGKFAETSAMFTEQGVQMPPNMPANVGRAAIRAGDSAFMGMGTAVLTITNANVSANGPVAIARSTWTFDFKPGKNAPKGMKAAKDHGKSLTHWHNVNGEWLMAEDIWNADTPAAGAPSMPAPAKPAAKKPTTRKK